MQTGRAVEQAAQDSGQEIENNDTFTVDEGAVGGQLEEVRQSSLETLRRDAVIMRQASMRLARLQQDDWEDEDDLCVAGTRLTGKMSGSVMTASDFVIKHID